jgi:hypothetical protein
MRVGVHASGSSGGADWRAQLGLPTVGAETATQIGSTGQAVPDTSADIPMAPAATMSGGATPTAQGAPVSRLPKPASWSTLATYSTPSLVVPSTLAPPPPLGPRPRDQQLPPPQPPFPIPSKPQATRPETTHIPAGATTPISPIPTRPPPQAPPIMTPAPPQVSPSETWTPDSLSLSPAPGGVHDPAERTRNLEFVTRIVLVANRDGLEIGDKICSCGAWRPAAQNGCECGQFVCWHHNETTPATVVWGKS